DSQHRVNTLAAALCYGPGRDSARPNAGSRRPATSAGTLAMEHVPENNLPTHATSLPCVRAGHSHTPDESERGTAYGLGPGLALERALLLPRCPLAPTHPERSQPTGYHPPGEIPVPRAARPLSSCL